jgi:broad specificity phosphatase PhoE
VTPAYVIRHGETAWSRDHRHTGRTDLPLTPRGEEQARALAARLQPLTFAHVLTSPQQRARVTCDLAGFGAAARIEADLREWDCGDYEGLTLAEIHTARPGWNLYRDGCPGGESPDQITKRADAVVARLAQLDGSLALFSHSHFLCALAARWIGLTASDGARFRLDTAAFGILDVEHESSSERSIAGWNLSAR